MDISFGVLVVAIGAFVEIIKQAFNIPSKFCSLISIVAGIACGIWLSPFFGVPLAEKIFGGIILGMSASGAYDLVKNPIKSAVAKLGKR